MSATALDPPTELREAATMRSLIALTLFLSLLGAAGAEAANPQVAIETSMGKIVLELYSDKTPKTAENFLAYVRSGFFEGTIFHRVRAGFMVQGGGFTADGTKKETRAPIQNEADKSPSAGEGGPRNARGTVAMARTGDPHSATAQFFINVVDNDYLDHTAKTQQNWGYTAFGKVVSGLDVVDAIAAVKTQRSGISEAQPLEPVTIDKVSVVAAGAAEE